ncbi:MAG: nucleotide exchange factor GrpE [Myxococcales bacterium]|nr:nucleotide exchange factor GrpE [Myxococcales bacterium]
MSDEEVNESVESEDADASEEATDAPDDGAEAAAEEEAPAVEPAPSAADEVAALQRQLEEWKTRAYRSAADLDNLRKRFQKERDELRKFGVEGLIKDLLPVVDNLERAMSHASSGDGLIEGVKMVLRQFTQTMGRYGAEPFDAVGQPFDPTLHEAMTQMVSTEVEPGHVSSVFQRGWMLHGRLVRPAMVIVAKAPEGQDEAEA